MILWTVGAALAAGAVLYVADWRPDLAPDGKSLQGQTIPRQTAVGAPSPSRELREPATTGSVEPSRRRSADTKPNEAKPVEAKPVEAKPVEAKPIEPRPIEAKPPETRPTPTDPGTRRDRAVADARQPRTVGPAPVLLPSSSESRDKGERLGLATRDAAPAESPAPKAEPERRTAKLASAAGPDDARDKSVTPAVNAAPEIPPMEDFEAEPAPAPRAASVPAAAAKPREATTKAGEGPPAPAMKPAARESASAAAQPDKLRPQVEEHAPAAAPVTRAARNSSADEPPVTQVQAGDAAEPVAHAPRKREPRPAVAERPSRQAAHASRRAAKRIALGSEATPTTGRSSRKLRRMARTGRPAQVARGSGGLDRVMDDFSRSGADYLHERTYRVSGGYLVERTTRYGSQYVLERTLRPVPW